MFLFLCVCLHVLSQNKRFKLPFSSPSPIHHTAHYTAQAIALVDSLLAVLLPPLPVQAHRVGPSSKDSGRR